jgi:hypothetical protein
MVSRHIHGRENVVRMLAKKKGWPMMMTNAAERAAGATA